MTDRDVSVAMQQLSHNISPPEMQHAMSHSPSPLTLPGTASSAAATRFVSSSSNDDTIALLHQKPPLVHHTSIGPKSQITPRQHDSATPMQFELPQQTQSMPIKQQQQHHHPIISNNNNNSNLNNSFRSSDIASRPVAPSRAQTHGTPFASPQPSLQQQNQSSTRSLNSNYNNNNNNNDDNNNNMMNNLNPLEQLQQLHNSNFILRVRIQMLLLLFACILTIHYLSQRNNRVIILCTLLIVAILFGLKGTIRCDASSIHVYTALLLLAIFVFSIHQLILVCGGSTGSASTNSLSQLAYQRCRRNNYYTIYNHAATTSIVPSTSSTHGNGNSPILPQQSFIQVNCSSDYKQERLKPRGGCFGRCIQLIQTHLSIETIGLSLCFIALLLALARDAYRLSILFTTQQDERDAKEQLKQQEKLKRSRQQRNDSKKVSRRNSDFNTQHQQQSQRHDSNIISNAGLTRRHASSRNDQQQQQTQYLQHQRTNSNLSSSAVEMPQTDYYQSMADRTTAQQAASSSSSNFTNQRPQQQQQSQNDSMFRNNQHANPHTKTSHSVIQIRSQPTTSDTTQRSSATQQHSSQQQQYPLTKSKPQSIIRTMTSQEAYNAAATSSAATASQQQQQHPLHMQSSYSATPSSLLPYQVMQPWIGLNSVSPPVRSLPASTHTSLITATQVQPSISNQQQQQQLPKKSNETKRSVTFGTNAPANVSSTGAAPTAPISSRQHSRNYSNVPSISVQSSNLREPWSEIDSPLLSGDDASEQRSLLHNQSNQSNPQQTQQPSSSSLLPHQQPLLRNGKSDSSSSAQ
jgi:hypothetical protein